MDPFPPPPPPPVPIAAHTIRIEYIWQWHAWFTTCPECGQRMMLATLPGHLFTVHPIIMTPNDEREQEEQ